MWHPLGASPGIGHAITASTGTSSDPGLCTGGSPAMRAHTIRARAAAIATLALALAATSTGGASAAPLSSAQLAPAQAAVAAPRVTLSPAIGPPTTAVAVSGTGFGAYERVDVYFGTTDLALTGTGGTGRFGPVSITV